MPPPLPPTPRPDFNPRSPYGERLPVFVQDGPPAEISIHAPLTGSDADIALTGSFFIISIHAPLTGSDLAFLLIFHLLTKFQSTLPLRGATLQTNKKIPINIDFNPRSPYGERHVIQSKKDPTIKFQSTLPLRGATSGRGRQGGPFSFQSTLPLRGATCTCPVWTT